MKYAKKTCSVFLFICLFATCLPSTIFAAAPTTTSAICIKGLPRVGEKLTTYFDIRPSDNYVYTISWLRSDSFNGTYIEVKKYENMAPDATAFRTVDAAYYELTDADEGKYIKYEITPVEKTNTAIKYDIKTSSRVKIMPKDKNDLALQATITASSPTGADASGGHISRNPSNIKDNNQGTGWQPWNQPATAKYELKFSFANPVSLKSVTIIGVSSSGFTNYALIVNEDRTNKIELGNITASINNFNSFEYSFSEVQSVTSLILAVDANNASPALSEIQLWSPYNLPVISSESYTIGSNGISSIPYADSLNLNTVLGKIHFLNGTTYRVLRGGNPITSGAIISGDIVELTAENGTTKEQYTFNILPAEPTAPEARNVRIDGTLTIGGRLEGKYDYFDPNSGDIQQGTKMQWYVSDSFDGVYTPISGATTADFTIPLGYENKAIKFGVIPKSNNGPNSDKEYFSLPFMRAVPPVVKKINLTGVKKKNNVLSARLGADVKLTFDYFDNNMDVEALAGSKFVMYEKNATDTAWQQVGSPQYSVSSTGITYSITNADVDKIIKFEITPISGIAPTDGVVYTSEEILCPATPKAKNVFISGQSRLGSILKGSFEYYDPNGDVQFYSKLQWYYVNGSDYAPITNANGIGYKLKKEDAGKTLVLEVTPKTDIAPFEGKPVKSLPFTVGKLSEYNEGLTVSGNNPSKAPTVENWVVPSFIDIDNHWARSDILNLSSKGYISGDSDDTFAPDRDMSRAELVALIARAFAFSIKKIDSKFADVSNSDWYKDYVNTLAQSGIMTGNGDKFRPNDSVSREEMAKVGVLLCEYLDLSATAPKVTVADVENAYPWAMSYIEQAYTFGFVKGNDDNAFYPKSNLSRAEACVMIARILVAKEGK